VVGTFVASPAGAEGEKTWREDSERIHAASGGVDGANFPPTSWVWARDRA